MGFVQNRANKRIPLVWIYWKIGKWMFLHFHDVLWLLIGVVKFFEWLESQIFLFWAYGYSWSKVMCMIWTKPLAGCLHTSLKGGSCPKIVQMNKENLWLIIMKAPSDNFKMNLFMRNFWNEWCYMLCRKFGAQ